MRDEERKEMKMDSNPLYKELVVWQKFRGRLRQISFYGKRIAF